MMKTKGESQSDVPYRRRGRPTGKNRVPLSLEERRARNALYERERRNETADAMAQLAEAIGCDPNISNGDLLATVITKIQSSMNDAAENIDELLRVNANLESQIAMLQDRLGLDDESFDQLDNEEFQEVPPPAKFESTRNNYNEHQERAEQKQSKKRKGRFSSEKSSKEKRLKTRSETSIDSGVEMQRQSVSPVEMCVTSDNNQFTPPEQLQLPVEVFDECASQTCVDLQTELYNQIYNSEYETGTECIPEGVSVSESCLESLTRSLIVVPSIISPQKPPDLHLEQQTQESTNMEYIEPPNDPNIFDLNGECEILPRVETTLDFLTDNERGLINDWLDGELVETSADDHFVYS